MSLESKLKKIGSGILIGSLLLFNGCERDNVKPDNTNYTLKNPVKVDLADNYEMPGSLSSYNAKSNSKKNFLVGEGELVFSQSPTFNGPPITDFIVNPGIYKLNTSSSLVDSIYTFPSIDLKDFEPNWVRINEDNSISAKGLILSNILLPDSSYLFASNFSGKLFKVFQDSSGQLRREIYLENEELIGISDMIYGSDGKIYATQQRLVGGENATLRDKRVISISLEDSVINEEFILPLGDNLTGFLNNGLSIGNKLDIIENLKSYDGSKFYVSDELAGVIYQVSQSNEVIPLVSNLNLPSSLAIQSNGKILTLTGPKMNSDFSDFVKYPELLEIDPINGKYSSIYIFENEPIEDYKTGLATVDSFGNQLPVEFYVSTIISEGETDSKLDSSLSFSELEFSLSSGLTLFFTKSLTGEVGMITFDKQLEEE
jgi:hypothetical protein